MPVDGTANVAALRAALAGVLRALAVWRVHRAAARAQGRKRERGRKARLRAGNARGDRRRRSDGVARADPQQHSSGRASLTPPRAAALTRRATPPLTRGG